MKCNNTDVIEPIMDYTISMPKCLQSYSRTQDYELVEVNLAIEEKTACGDPHLISNSYGLGFKNNHS